MIWTRSNSLIPTLCTFSTITIGAIIHPRMHTIMRYVHTQIYIYVCICIAPYHKKFEPISRVLPGSDRIQFPIWKTAEILKSDRTWYHQSACLWHPSEHVRSESEWFGSDWKAQASLCFCWGEGGSCAEKGRCCGVRCRRGKVTLISWLTNDYFLHVVFNSSSLGGLLIRYWKTLVWWIFGNL